MPFLFRFRDIRFSSLSLASSPQLSAEILSILLPLFFLKSRCSCSGLRICFKCLGVLLQSFCKRVYMHKRVLTYLLRRAE